MLLYMIRVHITQVLETRHKNGWMKSCDLTIQIKTPQCSNNYCTFSACTYSCSPTLYK